MGVSQDEAGDAGQANLEGKIPALDRSRGWRVKELTVCLVTYRNARGLERFLGTLERYSSHEGDVIVWDNNEEKAEQESVDNLLRRFCAGRGRRVGLGYNLFGDRAILEGRDPFSGLLSCVKSPFVAFMQDDMAFPPGSGRFWDLMVECAWWPEVGLVAPCSNELYECQQLHRIDLPDRLETNHVHGSAVVARVDVLREVGAWDVACWHGIDTDLCLRIRKAGYKILVERRAYIHHDPATTVSKVIKDLREKIILWGEMGRNEVMRKHGVEDYYNFVLCGGHDVNSAMVTQGWSWDSLEKELSRAVQPWIPGRSVA